MKPLTFGLSNPRSRNGATCATLQVLSGLPAIFNWQGG